MQVIGMSIVITFALHSVDAAPSSLGTRPTVRSRYDARAGSVVTH